MRSARYSRNSMTYPRASAAASAREAVGSVRWPSAEARAWAECAFADLCTRRNVVAVVLFGSAVRPVESSYDLDCLYIYRGARPPLPPAPMDVDLRAYPAHQVEELIRGGHDLLGWCLLYGRVLCERAGYWTRLGDKWRAQLPFPSADVADQRAAQAERLVAELEEIGDEDAAVEQMVTAATHRSRAALLRANVFPASRPELPAQLHQIGADALAARLATAMEMRRTLSSQYAGTHPQHD